MTKEAKEEAEAVSALLCMRLLCLVLFPSVFVLFSQALLLRT